MDRPRNWMRLVNQPLDESEEATIIQAIQRPRPYGSPAWVRQTAGKLGLEWTLNPRGRPRTELRPL
jgi:putative transposase